MSQSNRIHPLHHHSLQRDPVDRIKFHMNINDSSSYNLLSQTPIQNLQNHEEMNLSRVSKYMIPVDEEEEFQIKENQRLRKPPYSSLKILDR